jgi:hypothetical protein
MAAPVADKVLLPLDTGNTGKKVRTQTRTVGADSVHEHFFIPISKDSKTGFYRAHSGILTIPTSAHNGTSTGHLWFFNPVGNTIKARIRRLRETGQVVAGAIDLTAPRQLFNLFTFTGTASGTAITPAKRDSTDAAATCTLRTASTGATVTLGAVIRHTGIPGIVATASSATVQTMLPPNIYIPWDPDEEECIVLRAGEGVVLWSADASTTANRRLFSDWAWEEFE